MLRHELKWHDLSPRANGRGLISSTRSPRPSPLGENKLQRRQLVRTPPAPAGLDNELAARDLWASATRSAASRLLRVKCWPGAPLAGCRRTATVHHHRHRVARSTAKLGEGGEQALSTLRAKDDAARKERADGQGADSRRPSWQALVGRFDALSLDRFVTVRPDDDLRHPLGARAKPQLPLVENDRSGLRTG